MIVLIPYINLLNLSWIIKCLFLRNIAPLRIRGICFIYLRILEYFEFLIDVYQFGNIERHNLSRDIENSNYGIWDILINLFLDTEY